MNPLDRRKHLAAFAKELKAGKPITKEQTQYLVNVFERISKGEDANRVLGVAYSRGRSEKDALARQKLSMIFHWVACAIKTDPTTSRELSLEDALQQAHKLFKYKHDLKYLRDKWYEHKPMQSPLRTWSESDSPFHP